MKYRYIKEYIENYYDEDEDYSHIMFFRVHPNDEYEMLRNKEWVYIGKHFQWSDGGYPP